MAKKKKLKITDVQKAFNKAIVRRDAFCRVQDGVYTCKGGLQCSHFFTVGANSVLRFYPFNAFTQCAGHHFAHHHRNPLFYPMFMQRNFQEKLNYMNKVRHKASIKYTQEVLQEILDYCRSDNLIGLCRYIEDLIDKSIKDKETDYV